MGGGPLIFVTIGSMFPFDRLVRLVDELAPEFPNQEFFAQIAEGTYLPVNIPYTRMLSRREFSDRVQAAEIIIAHAGMGSVISAMELNKPIVIFPRQVEYGEVTTDHQTATARWLREKPGIFAAMVEADMPQMIAAALATPQGDQAMPTAAPRGFLDKISTYIKNS